MPGRTHSNLLHVVGNEDIHLIAENIIDVDKNLAVNIFRKGGLQDSASTALIQKNVAFLDILRPFRLWLVAAYSRSRRSVSLVKIEPRSHS